MSHATISERALVLAPAGRDAAIAAAMLGEAGVAAEACVSLKALVDELDRGAGLVVVTEEAFATADLHPLAGWIRAQREWSDLPFVLLTRRGGGLERNPVAARLLDVLGNVTFLERPFHPTTLISLAQSALRGRRRQYEARSRLEELRDSEQRYRTLFNSMDEGFCILQFIDGPDGADSDYIHVEANPAYERHAGIGCVGQKVRALLGDEAPGWIEIFGEVLHSGRSIRFQRELEATGRYLELAAFRIEPAQRRQVAVLFQDITTRKQAETALRTINETLERRVADALAERKLLADLVEGTDALVHVVDLDMTWLAVNRSAVDEFERLHGVQPKVGENMLRLLGHRPADRARLAAVWRRALAGEAFTEIVEVPAPDGGLRCYEMRFDVLRRGDGAQIGAYQFVYDVTEQLRAQARLAEATAQMHEMAKLETLGQLTGGVAHDFNNLLTPITGALDLLSRRTDNDARASRLIDGALQSADRAKTLVQRLLGFARRQALEAQPTDLAALVAGMHDLIASSIGSKIELLYSVPSGLAHAFADPNQLELAILNLCVNARDAMPDGGRLTIALAAADDATEGAPKLRSGRYLRLSVIDEGAGMDEATRARAIEPFFSTKEIGRGTGLGLSMVHGLAGQLGGGFMLASAPGRGTRAELWLPEAQAAASIVSTIEAAPPPQSRRLAVLLVDDEDLVREGTAELLRDLGHDVVAVDGGAAALDRLGDGAGIDVVITDFTMPRMDGAELARRIRARAPGLPILLVTGYAAGDLPTELPRLAKPFRRGELAAMLARLVEVPAATQRMGAQHG